MAEGASFRMPRPGWRVYVAAGLTLVVIVVVLVARVRGGSAPSGRPGARGAAATAPSPGAVATASPVPDDGVLTDPTPPSKQAAAPEALAAATAFTKAWAHHPDGITAAQWSAAVGKHADPVLAKQLTFTDPRLVPATTVTGPAVSLAGGVSSASVGVPTDAGQVVLTCTLVGGHWTVSDVDLQRSPE
ncbi:MAG: hypothetical protein JWO79_3748 [Actinomycetia bacterium]|nr:hypothetical protein [Actinomycetes bacterium]